MFVKNSFYGILTPMEQFDSEYGVNIKDRIIIEPPRKYNVVLLNDDFTTMDFVVAVLVKIFHHTVPSAEAIMENIHKNGKGIAGTYSKDIAMTKKGAVSVWAKEMGYPLRCEVEEA